MVLCWAKYVKWYNWGYNPLILTFDPNFQRDIQMVVVDGWEPCYCKKPQKNFEPQPNSDVSSSLILIDSKHFAMIRWRLFSKLAAANKSSSYHHLCILWVAFLVVSLQHVFFALLKVYVYTIPGSSRYVNFLPFCRFFRWKGTSFTHLEDPGIDTPCKSSRPSKPPNSLPWNCWCLFQYNGRLGLPGCIYIYIHIELKTSTKSCFMIFFGFHHFHPLKTVNFNLMFFYLFS